MTKAQPALLSSGPISAAETSAQQIVGVGGWTRHSPTGQNETAVNGNIRHFGTDPNHTERVSAVH